MDGRRLGQCISDFSRRAGLETRVYGIECGVSRKYAVTSRYSGLSGVNVAALGIHQFKTDRMVPCGTRGATVHGYHNFRDTSVFFGQPEDAYSGAKLTAMGIHQLKADPTVQEVSPRTAKIQRNPQRRSCRLWRKMANIAFVHKGKILRHSCLCA